VEDENIGLSLDGDEGTSPTAPTSTSGASMDGTLNKTNPTPAAAPLVSDTQDTKGPLKRAYDDALAARGLISVSRSSEKLTDLALPAKMQRTISQEYLKSMNAGGSTTFTTFSFNSNISQSPPVPAPVPAPVESRENNPAPLMHPAATQTFPSQTPSQNNFESTPAPCTSSSSSVPRSSDANDQVEVPATTKCALCGMTNVDTQLRPCGHMFHGRCLKPSMQNAVGAPQCPIDKITMLSAVLAVPTDDNKNICNPAP